MIHEIKTCPCAHCVGIREMAEKEDALRGAFTTEADPGKVAPLLTVAKLADVMAKVNAATFMHVYDEGKIRAAVLERALMSACRALLDSEDPCPVKCDLPQESKKCYERRSECIDKLFLHFCQEAIYGK